jgi:hypothetical protein
VWEKLSAIETNCAVEATLDACLARLMNKARERPAAGPLAGLGQGGQAGLSARIPSWLCMNAVGHQVVASWGNPLRASTSALWGPGGWRGQSHGGGLDAFGSSVGSTGGGLASLAAAAAAGFGGSSGAVGSAPAAPGPLAPGVLLPPHHPHAPNADALAAAAAAAMAGQARVAYHYPAAGLSASGPEAGLLAAGAHFPNAPAIPTIHEAMGDERPLRVVASWGSSAFVADSASDFPTSGSPRDEAPAGAPGGRRRDSLSVGSAGGGGDEGEEEDEDDGGVLGQMELEGGRAGAARRPGGPGPAVARGGAGRSPSAVRLAQLDCCDPTAVFDIWGGLLALGAVTGALEAGAPADGQGLDVIAP